MNRRKFLSLSARLGALTLLQIGGMGCGSGGGRGKLVLPALPYGEDALEPHISAQTLKYHYGKHHLGYLNKTNQLISDTPYAGMPLGDIIAQTSQKAEQRVIFNNAAQIYNHTFYWHSMTPGGGGQPTGKLAERIAAAFGGHDAFIAQFSQAAGTHFGSGWTWLVAEADTLKIVSTVNAETPMTHGLKPLLTIDLWEHAYYLDYQNRRKDYIAAYLAHLVNWDFAAENLG